MTDPMKAEHRVVGPYEIALVALRDTCKRVDDDEAAACADSPYRPQSFEGRLAVYAGILIAECIEGKRDSSTGALLDERWGPRVR